MRIYTRAEWGARPAQKVMPHCNKLGFCIHHTESANGILTVGQEIAQQRGWQNQHMGSYANATDILQAMSVFKSGRIFEGRMPWDADNGAAYGAGSDFFGIECDGSYMQDRHMEGEQYQALVWLCAEAASGRHGVRVPLIFYGHNQLGAWDRRNSSTSCPGNLKPDLIKSGVLEQDVRKALRGWGSAPKKEDDGMLYETDGKAFKVEDLYTSRYTYWLHIRNDSATAAMVDLKFLPLSGKPRTEVVAGGFTIEPGSWWHQDIGNIANNDPSYKVDGSFALKGSSTGDLCWSLRETPK